MQAIAAPRIPPELTPISNLRALLAGEDSIVGVQTDAADLTHIRAKAPVIVEARLDKLTASEASLERLGLTDVVVTRSDLAAANCAGASWRRVILQHIRGSGLALQTGSIQDVVFEDCKFDLANFRFAKLKHVRFENCILDEADFYMAELESVQFRDCSLRKAEFSAAKCKLVDLRTSGIGGISGIHGLAGATIDAVQLIAVAPLLASDVGLVVQDETRA